MDHGPSASPILSDRGVIVNTGICVCTVFQKKKQLQESTSQPMLSFLSLCVPVFALDRQVRVLLLKRSELCSCSGTRVTLEEIRVCGDPSGAAVGVETWQRPRVVGTALLHLPRWTRTHDGAQIVHGLHVWGLHR